jgi:glycerol-3-phosphate acyltransferase PlsX
MPSRIKAKKNGGVVAVDAAGGDYAPREVVKGAIKAAEEFQIGVALVGRRDIITVLGGRHLTDLGIEIVDASEVITFQEHPVEAVTGKPNSSIVVGTKLVKEGKASSFVSAGNTGAVFFAALTLLGKTEGVDRPAIATIINVDGGPSLLLDSGANADCRPEHLEQFAHLGAIYAGEIFALDAPRVGLLNVGSEEGKGNRLAKETFQLLKQSNLNFIGNVEGHDISRGTADIIVTDGFTGNIVLKTIEGLGDTILKIKNHGQTFSRAYSVRGRELLVEVGLGTLAKRMDYRQVGGASLLGLNGNVIIAHGRSQATAIKNAIVLAKRSAERKVWQKIKEANIEQTGSRGGQELRPVGAQSQ